MYNVPILICACCIIVLTGLCVESSYKLVKTIMQQVQINIGICTQYLEVCMEHNTQNVHVS